MIVNFDAHSSVKFWDANETIIMWCCVVAGAGRMPGRWGGGGHRRAAWHG